LKISVLISVYQKTTFKEFHKSFSSIISQTKKPDEIIIIFDGMVNFDIRFFLKNFQNVKIIQNSGNLGLGKSLSIGLKYCNTDIVIRQDSDTYNHKKRFFYIWKNLRFSKNKIVGSYMVEKNLNNSYQYIRKVPLTQSKIYSSLNYKNSFNHPAIGFNLRAIKKIGNYESMLFFEDYFLWLKAKKNNLLVKNISKILVYTYIDNNFFYRRLGIVYYKYYLKFMKSAYQKNYVNLFFLFFNLTIRLPLTFLNVAYLKFLYKFFLRIKLY
jgi:glycosyltransferase involved in cell wall biosynthesis